MSASKRCEASVQDSRCFVSRRCTNGAKFEVNGRHFCGIHNPNKKKTKAQIEADVSYALKWAAMTFKSDCVKLMKKMAEDGHVEASQLLANYHKEVENIQNQGAE